MIPRQDIRTRSRFPMKIYVFSVRDIQLIVEIRHEKDLSDFSSGIFLRSMRSFQKYSRRTKRRSWFILFSSPPASTQLPFHYGTSTRDGYQVLETGVFFRRGSFYLKTSHC